MPFFHSSSVLGASRASVVRSNNCPTGLDNYISSRVRVRTKQNGRDPNFSRRKPKFNQGESRAKRNFIVFSSSHCQQYMRVHRRSSDRSVNSVHRWLHHAEEGPSRSMHSRERRKQSAFKSPALIQWLYAFVKTVFTDRGDPCSSHSLSKSTQTDCFSSKAARTVPSLHDTHVCRFDQRNCLIEWRHSSTSISSDVVFARSTSELIRQAWWLNVHDVHH